MGESMVYSNGGATWEPLILGVLGRLSSFPMSSGVFRSVEAVGL